MHTELYTDDLLIFLELGFTSSQSITQSVRLTELNLNDWNADVK
jgi:hypothetical protein